MKIKSILASMLAVAALAGGTNEVPETKLTPGDQEAAYMSFRITTPNGPLSRNSSEEGSQTYEEAITSLYVVTFDSSEGLVYPAKGTPVTQVSGTDMTKPEVVKVSGSAKKLLLIANPGTELLSAMNGAYKGMSFSEFNKAVSIAFQRNTAAKPEGLVNEQRTIAGTKGGNDEAFSKFTMINSDGPVAIDDTKMQFVGKGYHDTEEEAIEAASKSRQTVKI